MVCELETARPCEGISQPCQNSASDAEPERGQAQEFMEELSVMVQKAGEIEQMLEVHLSSAEGIIQEPGHDESRSQAVEPRNEQVSGGVGSPGA